MTEQTEEECEVELLLVALAFTFTSCSYSCIHSMAAVVVIAKHHTLINHIDMAIIIVMDNMLLVVVDTTIKEDTPLQEVILVIRTVAFHNLDTIIKVAMEEHPYSARNPYLKKNIIFLKYIVCLQIQSIKV